MDQPPAQLNIPFGLIYKILSCFNRRELCQLRNVNHRHYTVIENKFGTTPPYLVFDWQYLEEWSWRWRPLLVNQIETKTEEMPIQVRNQMPLSKFIRFKQSLLTVYNPSESNIDLLSMSHVWQNQELYIGCGPSNIWNEDWLHIATKAKDLQLEALGIIHYLRQLTSGDCIRLSFVDWTDSLDTAELPWNHIIDFLLQPNPKDAKSIYIFAHSPFDHHQRQTLEFIQRMKQVWYQVLAKL